MKTILVDAINAYVNDDGTIFRQLHELLCTYPNNKVVLTSANEEQFNKFNLGQIKWPVFTLEHEPEKTDPEYYKILLNEYNLKAEDVIYFEHSADATTSARSVGISTHFYDHNRRDLGALKKFIDSNLS